MTDLLISDNGYDSIMVTVDYGLSKWIVLTLCTKKSLTSEFSAQLFINKVYSQFGLPDLMITDRETQFDAEFWTKLCKSLSIKHTMTTMFHPQANGGTE